MNYNIFNSAIAYINGSSKYPSINGVVRFDQLETGVMVTSEVYGLSGDDICSNRFHGMHIHSGNSCEEKDGMYTNAGAHLNLRDCSHPMHSGDLLPLFNNNGYAFSSVLYNTFTINDILDKVVIIHEKRDDFTTNPSGDSGNMIACGKITVNFI